MTPPDLPLLDWLWFLAELLLLGASLAVTIGAFGWLGTALYVFLFGEGEQ